MRAVPPDVVEQMRAAAAADGDQLTATLLSVLAYVGPRPFTEACGARWEDARERTLTLHAMKTRRGVAPGGSVQVSAAIRGAVGRAGRLDRDGLGSMR